MIFWRRAGTDRAPDVAQAGSLLYRRLATGVGAGQSITALPQVTLDDADDAPCIPKLSVKLRCRPGARVS